LLTIPLNIIDYNIELNQYIEQYTVLFYCIYNNYEKVKGTKRDKIYVDELLKKYNLIDVSMFDSCVGDVETKLEQHKTNETEKTKKINDLNKNINKLNKEIKEEKQKVQENIKKNSFYKNNNNKGLKWKLKTKYKLQNKLIKLKATDIKDSCFGGKAKLRLITKLKSELKYGIELKTKKILTDKQKESKIELLERTKQEFKKARSLGIYLVGRACEKGNRKINFDLNNNKITFKLNKDNHFEIKLDVQKRDKKTLTKLQEMSEASAMPLTVRILKNKVVVNYDNEYINGFAFDKTEYKKAINGITNKEEKTKIAKGFIEDQIKRKLKNKVRGRYFAYDSNPESIGFVIVDKLSDDPEGEYKIIYMENIDFTELNHSLRRSSDDKKTIHQNNKRKNELKNAWNKIFKLLDHYKVAYFVREDLSIKNEDHNKGTNFNRKVNNIWLRTESEKTINKFCQNLGITIIEVDPMFSSIIGNMTSNYYDTVASAMELVRRGITKYIKKRSIYPNKERINREKLDYLLGENVSLEDETTYSLCRKLSGLRVRNKDLSSLTVTYLCSKKSKVKRYIIPIC